MVGSSARRRKEERDLVEGRIGRGCIARSGGIGQGRDRTSTEGRQKRMMWDTNGDNPNGHCDVRGGWPA
jgi:hypothetical protein